MDRLRLQLIPLVELYGELSDILRPVPGKDYEAASKAALTKLESFVAAAFINGSEIGAVKKRLREKKAEWEVTTTTVMDEPPSLATRYMLVNVGDTKRFNDFVNKEKGQIE
jgi:hypothetical protein